MWQPDCSVVPNVRVDGSHLDHSSSHLKIIFVFHINVFKIVTSSSSGTLIVKFFGGLTNFGG